MYTLPELQYGYGDLGKYISEDIMKLHHTKHHQTYVDKLNAATQGRTDITGDTLEDMLACIDAQPQDIAAAVRNHGGGHYNHAFFWRTLNPNGGGQPTGEVYEMLVEKYGSFQAFVDAFSQKALSVFGSGWCWLQPDGSICTTQNQDNPLMTGDKAPLLGLDVWEHAYYLDYKNKRDDYIAAWWNVVDWQYVAERHAEITSA